MQTHPEDFRAAEREQQTKPAYIYVFVHTPFFGTPSKYHLTSYDQPIIVENLPASKGSNPQTFLAGQVAHSDIEQSSEQNAPTTDISVVLNDNDAANQLKRYFINAVPARIDVTVARVNSQALPGTVDWEQDVYTVFRGVKINVALEGNILLIQAINLMLQEDGRVPRFFYQKTCQHNFGMAPCPVNLDTAQFRIETTIQALSRVNRTVDIAEITLNGEAITTTTFIGGRLEVLNDDDEVINVITIGSNEILPAAAGTRLRLAWWDAALEVAAEIRVKRGCLRIVDACLEHGGIAEFGGTPKIPVNNPSIDGINT